MAVFEKETTKSILDDSIQLYCIIESAQNIGDHTQYVIRVQRGPLPTNSWTVRKRYSEFVELDSALKVCGAELYLPPKKMFGKMEREFIAERQRGLQAFLNNILSYPCLANSWDVKRFLDAANYTDSIKLLSYEQVSMMFRSDPTWQIVERILDFGSRLKKEFMLIRNVNDLKNKYLLNWLNFGPDMILSDKQLQSLLDLLSQFQHHHLEKIEKILTNSSGASIIKQFKENGSLKDLIYMSKPRVPYLKKYALSKKTTPIDYITMQIYAKQILTTLKYIYDKGYYYGHLHPGNISISDGSCVLMDLENSILGVPSLYRPFYVQYRKINTVEQIDVYNFGQTLYEMAVGRSLTTPTCESFPNECQPDIRSILECILTNEACKNGLPTIEQLLQHRFISTAPNTSIAKPQIKIPSKLKEILKQSKLAFEIRLKEEQKIISQQRKIEKSRDFHMSDAEKKKRRKAQILSQNEETTNCEKNSKLKLNESNSTKSLNSVDNGCDDSSSNNSIPAPPPAPAFPSNLPISIESKKDIDNSNNGSRSALLGSITNFKKNGLRKTGIDNQ